MTPSDLILQHRKNQINLLHNIKTKQVPYRYPVTFPKIGGVISDYVLNVDKQLPPEETNSLQDRGEMKVEPYMTLTVMNPMSEQRSDRTRRWAGNYLLTGMGGRQATLADIEDDDVTVHADPSRKDKDDKQEQTETEEELQPAIAQVTENLKFYQ